MSEQANIPTHEEALFNLLCQGNRAAFDQIYNDYWNRLFLYVVKVIQDKDAAQDIVQEIFVSLWLRKEEISNQSSLSGYLFTAARFKGINFIQDQIKRGKHNEQLAIPLSTRQDPVSEALEVKQLQLIINNELEKLPPKMREVFVLSRVANLSHKEISNQLNISDKTVKKQISNALKHFKMVLNYELLYGAVLLFPWEWLSL